MVTREVWVTPERIAGWIDRFGDRHGGYVATCADLVLDLVAGLKARTFEANPGSERCGRCDVRPMCKAGALSG